MPPPHPSTEPTGPRDPIASLMASVARADGVEPMSDSALLTDDVHVTRISVGLRDAPVGAAVVDGRLGVGEVAVAPEARGRGLGEQLLDATRAMGAHAWWAHGDLPAAQRLAARHGMRAVRRLWRFELALDDALPSAELPEGWSVRSFEPSDVPELLSVNREAFADLPDQGGWTGEDFAARQRAPWFRPADLLVLTHHRVVKGFHWTKVHGGGLGEVYVVALSPAVHGRGLGRALTVAGLRHLRRRGCCRAMLFVDDENSAAVRTYRRLGFEPVRLDVLYSDGKIPGREAAPVLKG